MYDEYREKRFAPPPLLKRMVLAGRFGKKSGRGLLRVRRANEVSDVLSGFWSRPPTASASLTVNRPDKLNALNARGHGGARRARSTRRAATTAWAS